MQNKHLMFKFKHMSFLGSVLKMEVPLGGEDRPMGSRSQGGGSLKVISVPGLQMLDEP